MPGDPVHGKGVRPRNGSCAERGKFAPEGLTVASLTLNESTATCQKWRGELSKLGPSCGKMAAQALLTGLGRRRMLSAGCSKICWFGQDTRWNRARICTPPCRKRLQQGAAGACGEQYDQRSEELTYELQT